MVNKKKEIERCEICLQPATLDYKIELSYYESGKKIPNISVDLFA